MTATRSRSSLALGAIALVGTAAWSLAVAAPAQAHDQLVSSSPADGAELATQPQTVDLVFTEEVVELGIVVEVADGAGVDWIAEAPAAEGAAVSVPLRAGMASGSYELRWRVVSSDGHPIDGVSTFTLLLEPAASPPVAPAEPTPAEPTPAEPTPAEQGASEGMSPARPDTVPGGLPLAPTLTVGGVMMVLVIAGAIVGRRLARRRESRER